MREIDITGNRFGQLIAVRRAARSPAGKIRYEIMCSCGVAGVAHASALRSGHTTRCLECANRSRSEKHTTHGLSNHPIRSVWVGMIQRCENSNADSYSYYGGRGIKVDPSWKDFATFWRDMGSSYRRGLTIDRRDNDGPYCKENCRWVTQAIQARNTRRNRSIETPFGSMLICDAAERSGILRNTLAARVNAGWPASKIFDPPMPKPGRPKKCGVSSFTS